MRKLIVLGVVVVAFLIAFGGVMAQQAPAEEFVGPFPSWRQITCTGGDDTALLQNEFNTLGRSGSPVLYINASTCRITSTLRLGQGAAGDPGGVQNITILGHDPSDTKILWAGSAGGAMIEADGVAHSRFGRLTWDGGGTAGQGWIDRTNAGQNYFPTGSRREDEVWQNIPGVQIYEGAGSTGTSEIELMREHFIGPAQMGLMMGNANTLDFWVWDSLFSGVTNGIGNYNTVTNDNEGGGDFGVNRSNFLNTQNADIIFGNVQAFASSRWNYSKGSGFHVDGFGVGRVNAAFTMQGNWISDFTNGYQSPAGNLNTGPFGILDNTIPGGKPGMMGAFEAYCGSNCMGDMWAVGNRYTIPADTGGAYYAPRFHGIDDEYGATITDPGPLNLPPTPPHSTSPVIEVQNGDIAGALAQAGNSTAIVHIPYGSWQINQTLEVGPNVTLTGDGYGATELAAGPNADPILHLAGPSHAVVRDLKLRGWDQNGRITRGLVIDKADQAGGLVHSEFALLQNDKAAWDINDLTNTTVDIFDDYNGANTHCGMDGSGPDTDYRVTRANAHIYNGAGAGTDAMFILDHATVLDETHYFEGNPGCQPAQIIAPNGSGSLTINEGNFSPAVGGFDFRSFNGSVTMVDFANTLAGDQPASNLTCRCFGPNTLVMGLAYGGKNEQVAPTFSGGPYLYWLGQTVNPNNPQPESSSGVSDQNQFAREHLALLRNSKPLSLERRDASVTDVRLYRVGGERLTSGIQVLGAGSPEAGPTSTPGPTNTPAPTNTVGPSPTPTNTRPPTNTSTPAPTPVPGQGVWLTAPASSVTANTTYEFSPAASILFTCSGGGWNAGEYYSDIIATFAKPTTMGGVQITAVASPDADESWAVNGFDGNRWQSLGSFQIHVTGEWRDYQIYFPYGTYQKLELNGTNHSSWLAMSQVKVLQQTGTNDTCGNPFPTATPVPVESTPVPTLAPTSVPVVPTSTVVPPTVVPTSVPPTSTPEPVQPTATPSCYTIQIRNGHVVEVENC